MNQVGFAQENRSSDKRLKTAVLNALNPDNANCYADMCAVERLIDEGSVDINEGGLFRDGSPLRHVIFRGNKRLFDKFLQSGRVELGLMDPYGATCFFEAVKFGRDEMFEEMLALYEPSQREKDNLLIWAARENHITLVKRLIELGADIHFHADDAGKGECYRLAKYYRYMDIVNLLDELYAKEDYFEKKIEGNKIQETQNQVSHDGEFCPICDENVCDTKTICKHDFCNTCLKKWIEKNNSCPMCRKNLAS